MKKASTWFKSLASKGSLKQFYTIYLVAFAVIALVAVLSQVFIQDYLGKQTEDSYLVNVAGKQRMLSQKITKSLFLYDKEPSDSLQKVIFSDLAYWSRKHDMLKSGKLIDSKYNTPDIDEKYNELDVYLQKIQGMVIDRFVTNSNFNIDTLVESENIFLNLMDEIVDEYDKNYHLKIKKLRSIEFILATVLVVVLILEMLLVFIPLIRMLSQTIKKLRDSEYSTKKLAKNLNQANIILQQRNKEISDTNLALDRAVILIRTDPEGHIIYANEQYCDLTKYSLKELINKPLFYNNLGGAESIIYNHIRNPLHCRNVWQNEVHDTASDSSDFWLHVTLFPIINNQEELYEYLVICNDITKRKLTENELVLLNENKFLKQEEEQKIKSKSIIEGQEGERKRMAVEVHDGLGQMLTALKFNCEAMDSKDATQTMVLKNMKSLLQQIIVETRRISSDLLPSVLSDFGLVAGLKEMVKTLAKVSDVKIIFENKLTITERLRNENEIASYRVAQEAINNALKHSDAKTIELVLSNDAEYFYLMVKDDGKGILDNQDSAKRTGNGLRNMQERARLIEGNLYINSALNKGTQVLLEIPIE